MHLPAALEYKFACTSNIKLYNSIYSISHHAKAFLMMELLATFDSNDYQAAPYLQKGYPSFNHVSKLTRYHRPSHLYIHDMNWKEKMMSVNSYDHVVH